MLIPDLAETLLIAFNEEKQSESERRLSSYGDGVGVVVDLSPYIMFKVERGHDETSAPLEDLRFEVYVQDFQNDRVFLQFKFEKWFKVSIGVKPD